MRTLPLFVAASFVFAAGCSSTVEAPTGTTSATGTGGAGGGTTSSVSTTAATGTGGAPDIGQPSDVYPAPHPAPPQVEFAGGAVMTTPAIYPILFKSDVAATKASITEFSSKVAAGNYWAQTTYEYGVGPATSYPPIELDETVAANITDAQIQAWLAAKLNADDVAFPTATGNTLFVIYYPAGITITLPDGNGGQAVSCQPGGFGGYHSSLTLNAAHNNQPVPYAVVPRCGTMADVTTAASHELIEAATDPFPLTTPAYGQVDLNHIYWEFALGGGEVGDMCAQGKNADVNLPEIGFLTQRSWSNASILAGHDPCVPRPMGEVYFAAVPVLKDQLNLGQGLAFKGVKIPVGQSKTIDVKLFSDGPTNGPFTVDAFDSSMFQGGPQNLDLSFDVNQGQNGQTLHLTINVLSASQFNAEIFYVTASQNNVRHRWIGIVGN